MCNRGDAWASSPVGSRKVSFVERRLALGTEVLLPQEAWDFGGQDISSASGNLADHLRPQVKHETRKVHTLIPYIPLAGNTVVCEQRPGNLGSVRGARRSVAQRRLQVAFASCRLPCVKDQAMLRERENGLLMSLKPNLPCRQVPEFWLEPRSICARLCRSCRAAIGRCHLSRRPSKRTTTNQMRPGQELIRQSARWRCR
jgi:hypothetical protein